LILLVKITNQSSRIQIEIQLENLFLSYRVSAALFLKNEESNNFEQIFTLVKMKL